MFILTEPLVRRDRWLTGWYDGRRQNNKNLFSQTLTVWLGCHAAFTGLFGVFGCFGFFLLVYCSRVAWMRLGDHQLGRERHSCLSNLPWWSRAFCYRQAPSRSFQGMESWYACGTCSRLCVASTHKATIFHTSLTSVISHLPEKMGKIHHFKFQRLNIPWLWFDPRADGSGSGSGSGGSSAGLWWLLWKRSGTIIMRSMIYRGSPLGTWARLWSGQTASDRREEPVKSVTEVRPMTK